MIVLTFTQITVKRNGGECSDTILVFRSPPYFISFSLFLNFLSSLLLYKTAISLRLRPFFDLSRGLYFSKIKKAKILSYSYQKGKTENWRKISKIQKKGRKKLQSSVLCNTKKISEKILKIF